MIPLKDQEMIREKFAQELLGPVKIDLFTERELGITVPGRRPCQYCKPTQEMLQEIAGLHPMISLRLHYMEDNPPEAATYGIERVPGIVLRGMNGYHLTYYGIPPGPSSQASWNDRRRLAAGILLSEDSLESSRGHGWGLAARIRHATCLLPGDGAHRTR
jgi:hypothetical protein